MLQENTEYHIEYESGTLRINPALLLSYPVIKVKLEENALVGTQQKTFPAGRLDYLANKNMIIGATFMKLNERSFSEKVYVGSDLYLIR